MEQQDLRQWEWLCIQEEPPLCQATCPIHVDVRLFARHMAAGKVDDARKVLAKTMPLSGVLGRICDHPCEQACRRGDPRDGDEAIRIGSLERSCVTQSDARPRSIPVPPKGKSAAVVGGGLSGLTAAWDLARKGYAVHVLVPESEIGGVLLAYPDKVLPKEALVRELELMASMRITIETNASVDAERVESLLGEHLGVYIGLDSPALIDIHLDLGFEPDAIDPLTRGAGRPGLFAGAPIVSAPFSPIRAALHGRQAAVSLDRLAQGASLTASRDKEGPFETRLYTSMHDVEHARAVKLTGPDGYSPEEARQEAARCIQCECMECVKVCPYLAHFKGYPKKYAREIYNNLSVIHGLRQANTMIESCSNCGLCAEVCPNDFHMGTLCLQARSEMVQQDKMPPSAFDFALRDLDFNVSHKAVLARPDPDTGACEWAFVPGCQLSGATPEHVRAAYDHLRANLDGGVGMILHCCGAPAAWAGRPDLLANVTESFRSLWKELGEPRLILACTTCLQTFREHLPEMVCTSLWETLESLALPQGAGGQGAYTLHDPCTSRHEPAVQVSARAMAKRLGVIVRDPDLTGIYTECCGFGGLMEAANPGMATKVVAQRTTDNPAPFLAYCAMCRDSLSRQGAKVIHLLDLLYPHLAREPEPASPYPLIRSGSGPADKHENRARLRNQLAREIWKEAPEPMDDFERIQLVLEPEVRDAVDARRILAEDIQRAILHAETTGRRMRHEESGHFIACHQPAAVTYWVEYAPQPEGLVFRVYRAWSHRMVIKGVA
ncbi:4Fe-4S ferredoxin [Oceanidesulfovibrio indonesiensis]|uniref:4Fe-4S ferredoxin n=1 Tax=Oceanidesulfovibrio indonesiensis TaxID=54767 RepID=A0A7M3MDI0_9BACT|nr:pyridine nucleotide-disulfide oxidoreductase/dicluster-binding protein [Oceanidesulfovibrio indonesiensis]TVM16336.1 4Fe-4S ferredoxin [Oceanidesulfovibrio indonesiensis]